MHAERTRIPGRSGGGGRISRDQLRAVEWARGRLRQHLMNLAARYAAVEVAQVRTPRGGLLRFERAGGGTLRYFAQAPSKRWKSKRPGRWVEAAAMTTLRDLLDAESACHELSDEHDRLRRAAEQMQTQTTQETVTC